MTKDDVYNFSYIAYIDKENETYFTYSFFDTSIQARLVMDTSGQIEMFLWLGHIPEWSLFWSQPQQRRHCQSDAYCGAFSVYNENSSSYCNCLTGFMPSPSFANNYSADCVRRVDLECGNADSARGKKNRFLMSSHMELPDFPQSIVVASVEECEANCLNNCSCTAYAYYDSGCSIWNGVLVNLKQLSVDDGNGKAVSVTIREGDLISLLDHRLDNIADAEEVTRICRVACWCIQDEENLRPSMGQILEGVLDIKLPQMPVSLQVFANNQEEHMRFFTELSSGLGSHA
ncbi:hypothetical protein LguiB_002451 [Lonicera macranthoides]